MYFYHIHLQFLPLTPSRSTIISLFPSKFLFWFLRVCQVPCAHECWVIYWNMIYLPGTIPLKKTSLASWSYQLLIVPQLRERIHDTLPPYPTPSTPMVDWLARSLCRWPQTLCLPESRCVARSGKHCFSLVFLTRWDAAGLSLTLLALTSCEFLCRLLITVQKNVSGEVWEPQ